MMPLLVYTVPDAALMPKSFNLEPVLSVTPIESSTTVCEKSEMAYAPDS